MIPIPENSSRKSSSLVLAASKPLIKIRFVVSSNPSKSHPCCAARSCSINSRGFAALHRLHVFRHAKFEF